MPDEAAGPSCGVERPLLLVGHDLEHKAGEPHDHADDGDEVTVFRARDVHDPDRLPSADELLTWSDDALAPDGFPQLYVRLTQAF